MTWGKLPPPFRQQAFAARLGTGASILNYSEWKSTLTLLCSYEQVGLSTTCLGFLVKFAIEFFFILVCSVPVWRFLIATLVASHGVVVGWCAHPRQWVARGIWCYEVWCGVMVCSGAVWWEFLGAGLGGGAAWSRCGWRGAVRWRCAAARPSLSKMHYSEVCCGNCCLSTLRLFLKKMFGTLLLHPFKLSFSSKRFTMFWDPSPNILKSSLQLNKASMQLLDGMRELVRAVRHVSAHTGPMAQPAVPRLQLEPARPMWVPCLAFLWQGRFMASRIQLD